VHEGLEVLRALIDLVRRDWPHVGELASGLFAHLAAQRVLDRFAVVDAASGKQPRTAEGSAALAHEKDAARAVHAGDDGGDAPSLVDGKRVGRSA
jgi:hypothetical protein